MENLNLSYMGPVLKDARLKSKLTQDKVAERVGITTCYLMAIENEGKCPALDVWFRLIRTLHICCGHPLVRLLLFQEFLQRLRIRIDQLPIHDFHHGEILPVTD